MKLKRFIQQETVLSVAAVLAVVSAFAVPPDAGYLTYLDLRTLATLFALMTVMAGLRRQGVFDRLGRALLARTQGLLPLVGLLVGLCFFGSMFITNDVALLTFVPFTFSVLRGLGAQTAARLTLPIVCMQTVAANLGSMLTPVGNPQNLYLYGLSGLGLPGFLALMLPYTAVSLLLLAVWTVALCRRTGPAPAAGENAPAAPAAPALPAANTRLLWMYAVLFVLCLLAVARVLPYPAAFAAVLAAVLLADRPALRLVDYSLLLTFAAFFVFIGNLGRVPAFSAWLQALLARAGGSGGGAGVSGHQQCARGAAAVRLYGQCTGPHRRHQPRRPRHADRLHGEPDLLPADRARNPAAQRRVFPAVYGCQRRLPGPAAGLLGRVGVIFALGEPPRCYK